MNLKYLNILPDEILEEYILPNLPIKTLVWLNKENYEKYQDIIFKKNKNKDKLIKNVLRNDDCFVFNYIIKNNFEEWLLNNNMINYNKVKFKNYINFINFHIKKYNSYKCNSIFLNKIRLASLSKKWHKNNINKNITWTN